MSTKSTLRAGALAGVATIVLGAGLATAPGATATAAAAGLDCNRIVGTPGQISSLKFDKRQWPLTGGLHMHTYNGNFGRNTGIVDGTTHLYNSYWGMGYHGQTMVLARNSCGELIGVTEPKTYGVDAKAWFWNANERRQHWTAKLPADIAQRTASVEVVHNRVSGPGDYKEYNRIRDLACAIAGPFIPAVCALPKL